MGTGAGGEKSEVLYCGDYLEVLDGGWWRVMGITRWDQVKKIWKYFMVAGGQ